MKEKLLMLLACFLISMEMVTAQTLKVTGVVISEEDGLPVVGASILVKNTTIGTVTDMDGKFQLSNIPVSAKTLMVSFIGMRTQELPIKARMNIVLTPESEVLDEIMVVAYGTARKSSFTGSASVIKADEVSTSKESLVKSLQGKMAGVRVGGSTGDPGSDQNILVRGISSISASSQPLYVIDGVAIVNDDMTSGLKSQSVLSSLNPDDIESLTVL